MTDAIPLDPRWEHLRALFAGALDRPKAERSEWLKGQCGDDDALRTEIEGLLAASEGPANVLDHGVDRLVSQVIDGQALPPDPDPRIGTQLDAYRLVALLGSGGMGSVYLAERMDGQFDQRVALKLLQPGAAGPEMRDRLLRERAILARLVHPNIAQLHDGGVAGDGTPYFTLEYIEGEAITHWCDNRRLGVADRVRMLLKVCDAVQYAHRNLVVHRDLKPSNILVTAASEPKLLDFGIAKLLADDIGAANLTGTQSRPMTREYAAPEQVLAQPITTATDVYTLGVLLYELLCGRLPYPQAERGAVSWPKAIVEEAPEPLSRAIIRYVSPHATDGLANAIVATMVPADAATLAAARGLSAAALRRALRGDLDRIVRRALEKSPDARYVSVSDFARDLRAHLDGRALPGGNWRYRLGKFTRRHWLPLAAGAAVLAASAIGVFGIVWEARETLREAQKTAAVKDFLVDLFQSADPNATKGRDVSARELVDRGVQRVDQALVDQPETKAELQATLGKIYYTLGQHKAAAELLAQAFNGLVAVHADPRLIARTEGQWANASNAIGDLKKARELADDAVQRLRRLSQTPKAELIEALRVSGNVADWEGDNARVMTIGDEALQVARLPPIEPKQLAKALGSQGNGYLRTNQFDKAFDAYKEELSLETTAFGADDEHTLNTVTMIGSVMTSMGRYAEARDNFERVLAAYTRIYGAGQSRVLLIEDGLALVLFESGEYASARGHFEHALAELQKNPDAAPRNTALIQLNLGPVLADVGELDHAEEMLHIARAQFQQLYGEHYVAVTEALSGLGYVHTLQGRLELAEEELRQAVADLDEAHELDVSWNVARLSNVRRLRGDAAEAITLGERARDNALQIYGEHSRQAAWAHYFLGLAMTASNRIGEGESELRASLASFVLIRPPDGLHPFSANPRFALGQLLATRAETRDEAVLLLRDAVSLRTATFGSEHPLTREARAALAGVDPGAR